LPPGQGRQRRANALRLYKAPLLTGKRSTEPPPAARMGPSDSTQVKPATGNSRSVMPGSRDSQQDHHHSKYRATVRVVAISVFPEVLAAGRRHVFSCFRHNCVLLAVARSTPFNVQMIIFSIFYKMRTTGVNAQAPVPLACPPPPHQRPWPPPPPPPPARAAAAAARAG
jgi:hypothetical protein